VVTQWGVTHPFWGVCGRRTRRARRATVGWESIDHDDTEADGAVVIRARSVLVAIGAGLVAAGVLIPTAHAQTPPPSSPPDLGLPPATTRPPTAEAPGTTIGGGGSTRRSGEADDGSFGATLTEPRTLVAALALALGLGVAVGAALYLRRYRRRQRELLKEWANASADAVAAKLAEADQKLAEADHKLAEADQQKSELLALVSHELGKPLTAARRFVDTVRLHWGELPEARRRDLLDRASLNADELSRLVRQLLDFSGLDAQRVTMTPQPILVSETVERTLDDLGPVLADHRVYVDMPDGLTILADVAAFGDVLTNLLTNAAKFSPPGRRIIVSATLADGAVDMSISDEGRGIPREEQALIFDPFYQSPSNKGSQRGTGIGLTIAKRFTEMQGGELAVVSEPGLGSTFWVTMPAAAGPARKLGDTHHGVAS
jgi:signal transduction histidine kinase